MIQVVETPGGEPISDDEFLYRRVSRKAGFYNPQRSPILSHAAFTPNRNDADGLSLVRAKYATMEEAAVGNPEAQYFGVARIGRDQVEDYARRRGVSLEQAERWLRPNIGY